jgi:hypothetical protein
MYGPLVIIAALFSANRHGAEPRLDDGLVPFF